MFIISKIFRIVMRQGLTCMMPIPRILYLLRYIRQLGVAVARTIFTLPGANLACLNFPPSHITGFPKCLARARCLNIICIDDPAAFKCLCLDARWLFRRFMFLLFQNKSCRQLPWEHARIERECPSLVSNSNFMRT